MKRTLYLLSALLLALIFASSAFAEDAAYNAEHPETLSAAHLSGQACIAMDMATGEILFQKNERTRMYPASTTKIMTLIVALEKGPSLDTVITIPKEAGNVPKDSSKVPVKVGETMTFADLLYGFMIQSGNDAGNSIAMITSGSISDFVSEMNNKAQEIGCTDTHFVNPHGYQDASHYTTAYDLARMAQYGMRNDVFRAIVAAKEYTMAPTALRDKLTLSTKNSMFVSTSSYYYPYLNGVKTGWTSSAGHCFVGSAQKGSAQVLSVTMKTTKEGRWTDTKKLMEYAFTRYQTYTFDDLYSRSPIKTYIEGADSDDAENGYLTVRVVPGSSLFDYEVNALPSALDGVQREFADALEVTWSRELKAPVAAGDILGTLSLDFDGQVLSGLLVAERAIEKAPERVSITTVFPALKNRDLSAFRLILTFSLLLIAILIILRTVAVVKRNRRRKQMLRRRKRIYERYRRSREE
ncbi:MAG: D-alanyl-D-alanine carboxypeptidase family protein [Christensenellales bacterium]|jgi:D-alanyl-D-alanine carboxypeptidase (penicillin-binding protein 5/6)